MTTIIERDGDGGGALAAVAVIIAALVVAFLIFGMPRVSTDQAPNSTTIKVETPAPPTPAPSGTP